MNYKKTINIPSTSFPMRANLVENQPKWQELWKQKQVFKKLKAREGKEFILHDGPPYANGNIHVGHALNKILKDFVIRHKALLDYKIEYIPGWDTHGLPIENRLEKTLGNEYKSKSTEEKRKICREYAEEQIEIQKNQFKKLNLIADFEEIYKTLSPECISNELDLFCELVKKDLIYWSLKPVAWSWSSQTALAESEVIYKEVENESIYFSFPVSKPFKDLPKNTKFLIWTTTPYTLEANLAIAFNPNLKYLLISNKQENIVIQEDRYKSLKEELELDKYEIIGDYFGNYFERATYINTITGEERFAINAEYITSDTGTGIVHIAPGFGLEDYICASKYGISMHCEINELGYFTPQSKIKEFSGHFYLEVSKLMTEILRSNGSLFKIAKIKHKVGHDWRTEKPILYRASPQWFINIAKIKNKFEGMDSDFESTPDWIKTKLKNLIISRKEWCISRQRSWGTPIPIIFFNEQPILEVSQIKHTISLLKKHGVDAWFREKAEFFIERKEKGTYRKSTDVLDVWFDSGSTWKMLGGRKADIYLEGFDQLRGWFNSSATISKAVEDRLPFKKIVGHGFVLDENGNKMSKSRGNVIDPLEIVEKYGADILRLWIGSQDYRDDLKLSTISLENSISTYRKIRNTLFRYSLSIFECFREFKPNPEVLKSLKYNENQFIYWKFKNINAEVKNSLEKNHFFTAIHLYSSFLHNEWSWYLEISKDILYCGEEKENHRLIEIQNVIYSVFWESLLVWSIFIPQTAEEVYSYIEKENKQESIFLETLSLTTDSSRLENGLLWTEFFKLKNQIYTEVEKLKNIKVINNSSEAKVKISKNSQNQEILNSWDLIYLLNIAEIEILEDQKNISLEKSQLPKCERCKKHKNMDGSLCNRCKQNISA